MIERALTHNHELPRSTPILSAALAILGQERKAQAALENFKQTWAWYFNFRSVMFNFPFQDPKVLERFADGIRKAGLAAVDYKVYKLSPDNMLNEEEIRALIFGRTIEGVWLTKTVRSLYRVERTEDGKATWTFPPDTVVYVNDSGRSWIEDDMLCNQWKIHVNGLEHCMSIFRNPEGTPEMKNEYIAVSDFEFQLFSSVE